MSDTSQGPGWWLATDGNWYPPERHPDYTPTSDAATAASSDIPPTASDEAVDKVRRLREMLDAGRLRDDEFWQMRKEILGL
jgi:hypothetical protein